MTIFGNAQTNIFNLNLKAFEKNILNLSVDSMEYIFEKKWKNDNEFKTPMIDLYYHPEAHENLGSQFISRTFKIIFNEKNNFYYFFSDRGIYKSKDFIDFKKVFGAEVAWDRGFGNSVDYYNGKIFFITNKGIMSIDKDDSVNLITNQIAESYQFIKINSDGIMYLVDFEDNIYIKQWNSILKKGSLPIPNPKCGINSIKVYNNYVLLTSNYGVFLSKDNANSFIKIIDVNLSHSHLNEFVSHIDENGINVIKTPTNTLYQFKFDGANTSRSIDLNRCKHICVINDYVYAFCQIGGVFKSNDWIYWNKVDGILQKNNGDPNLSQDYYAVSMVNDERFEAYSSYQSNIRFKQKS